MRKVAGRMHPDLIDDWYVRLREAASAQGLTQKAIADASGLSLPSVCTAMNGREKTSFKTLAKVCAILNIDYRELFAPPKAMRKRLKRKPGNGGMTSELAPAP